MRNATGKIRGAIDWIHHPDALTDLAAALFAEKTVIRESRRDRAANMRFGSRIRHRQKILRPLHRKTARGLALKTFQHQLPGGQDNAAAQFGSRRQGVGIVD
ncbi:hypothetical protein D3C86_1461500 [compost metagenome]